MKYVLPMPTILWPGRGARLCQPCKNGQCIRREASLACGPEQTMFGLRLDSVHRGARYIDRRGISVRN